MDVVMELAIALLRVRGTSSGCEALLAVDAHATTADFLITTTAWYTEGQNLVFKCLTRTFPPWECSLEMHVVSRAQGMLNLVLIWGLILQSRCGSSPNVGPTRDAFLYLDDGC